MNTAPIPQMPYVESDPGKLASHNLDYNSVVRLGVLGASVVEANQFLSAVIAGETYGL